MPYRRLPTTDKARIRALDAILKMANKKPIEKLAFSKMSLKELQEVKQNFENAHTQYGADLKTESDKKDNYKATKDAAKMYLSHFIQILLLANERGEINGGLKFYGELEKYNGKVPPLDSEEEILNWGKTMVEGEQKRIQNGGNALYNPSIALVKIKLEAFNDAVIFQNNLKKNTKRSYEKIQEVRKSTNQFISKIWTEIEENIHSDSPKHNRQMAQEYGIVYVFRRNEKKQLKPEELQRDLLFDFG